jgi:hypothetical protein
MGPVPGCGPCKLDAKIEPDARTAAVTNGSLKGLLTASDLNGDPSGIDY